MNRSARNSVVSIRLLLVAAVACLLSAAAPSAFACSCTSGHTACGEIAVGSSAFIGRVISVSPPFLNRFNPASRTQVGPVTELYHELQSGQPAESLQALRAKFRAVVSNLAPSESERLDRAKSRQDILRIFDSLLDHGSYVQLLVKTVFAVGSDDDDDPKPSPTAKAPAATVKPGTVKAKAKDDDDDDKAESGDDDDPAPGKIFSVWTPTFDCGIEFQVGETYLVYASADEDTDTVETDSCMGTRRLSDAGADLPYLSFLKNDPDSSAHLDGFVTSDFAVKANPPETDTMPSAVGGMLIELKSDAALRYATSSEEGRFTFDGLEGAKYEVRGYAADYPDPKRLVAGPENFEIKARACARHVLLVPPEK